MTATKKYFESKLEAAAFREGAEYVNDSAVTLEGPEWTKNGWTLTIHDEDAIDNEDETVKP